MRWRAAKVSSKTANPNANDAEIDVQSYEQR